MACCFKAQHEHKNGWSRKSDSHGQACANHCGMMVTDVHPTHCCNRCYLQPGEHGKMCDMRQMPISSPATPSMSSPRHRQFPPKPISSDVISSSPRTISRQRQEFVGHAESGESGNSPVQNPSALVSERSFVETPRHQPDHATTFTSSMVLASQRMKQRSIHKLRRMTSLTSEHVPIADSAVPFISGSSVGEKETARPIEYELSEQDSWWHVDPYTDGLVINSRTKELPRETLQLLWFHEGGLPNNKLVSEFHYKVSTKLVDCEEGRREETTVQLNDSDTFSDSRSMSGHNMKKSEETHYARLVTINWWLTTLFFALGQAAIIISDMVSNLIFSVNIMKNPQDNEDAVIALEFKVLFLLLFVVLDANMFRICYKLARDDVAILKRSGDWVCSSWRDDFMALLALVIFHFLSIPQTVKEIVRLLHPMKAAQPFAALKCDGHRCFVVGWPTRHAFRVSDNRGRDRLLPPFLWTKSVLTSYRFIVAVYTRDSVAAATCLTGVGALVVQGTMFIRIQVDRKKHHRWLCEQMKENNLPVDEVLTEEFMEKLDPKQKAFCHLAQKHFDAHKYPLKKWWVFRQLFKNTRFFEVVLITIAATLFTCVMHLVLKLVSVAKARHFFA